METNKTELAQIDTLIKSFSKEESKETINASEIVLALLIEKNSVESKYQRPLINLLGSENPDISERAKDLLFKIPKEEILLMMLVNYQKSESNTIRTITRSLIDSVVEEFGKKKE